MTKRAVLILILLLSTAYNTYSLDVMLERRLDADTLAYGNSELRAYYNAHYKLIDSVLGMEQVRVLTHQFRPAGKWAKVYAPNSKLLKAQGLRAVWVRFEITDGAIVIDHTPVRYRYYDFDANTAQTVIATTEVLGTAGQWEVVRQAIRDKVNGMTGRNYD